MVMKQLPTALVAFALLGCGDVGYHDPPPEECPPQTAGGEEGTPDELSELMAEVIAPRICDRMVGSFVGLPGDETHDGAAGGRDPAVGRWWVRRCEAQVLDGRLRVSFGGPGWSWLDRESMGFRVRQYLRFDASASLEASLHIGYDGRTRIASVWLRPQPGVRATVEPTGLIRAEATDVFSGFVGGLLGLTGNSPNAQARTQAANEGSERLATRLQDGFTVTFELDTEQLDYMLGQLPRGVVPERPWDRDGVTWLINERSAVWPGGVDVLGPIPADAGQVTLDVELEQGEGAVVRRVCADEMHRWLDAAWGGREPPRLGGTEITTLTALNQPQHPSLSALECPALLVVTPTEGAQTHATLRYRVTTEAARTQPLPTAEGGPPAVTRTPSRPTAPPTALRLRIGTVQVNARDASGNDWDMVGGAPDPYVVITSVRQGRELHRTSTVDDTRESRIDQWLPAPIPADALPVRIVVYDEDVTGDEVIGAAQIDADVLEGGERELTLPLTARGRAAPAGTVTVRVQPER